MIYKIALLNGDGIGKELLESAKLLIEEIGRRYNISFKFTEFLVGGECVDKYEVPIQDETINALKTQDAILLGTLGGEKYNYCPIHPENALPLITKALNLYSIIKTIPCYKKDNELKMQGTINLVTDSLTGVSKNEFSYTSTESGRGAYDKLTYSELEIEKIGRVAYELSESLNKNLTLIDKSNYYLTSRLWRKIITDINEDYTSVQLQTIPVGEYIYSIYNNIDINNILLSSNMFADTVVDAIKARNTHTTDFSQAFIGDNLLGLYTVTQGPNDMFKGTGIINPISMVLSVANMFLLTFNKVDIYEKILSSLKTTINNKKLPYELGGESRIQDIMEEIINNL